MQSESKTTNKKKFSCEASIIELWERTAYLDNRITQQQISWNASFFEMIRKFEQDRHTIEDLVYERIARWVENVSIPASSIGDSKHIAQAIRSMSNNLLKSKP